jgi:predicted nucleic acid-binding protein
MGMRDVVIDTGAASLLQRRQAPPWVLRQLAGARIWLTFITVGELADWAVRRKWDEPRRGRLDAWTAERPVIPYDSRIARLWGDLAGQAQLRGRPRRDNHAWIAACCLRYRLPLLTLHSTDFDDFGTFHGLTLLGDRALIPGVGAGSPDGTGASPGQDGGGDQG